MYYLGLVDVVPSIRCSLFGVTVTVSAGLLTVALCHYLGIARLGFIGGILSVSVWANRTSWAYPAFGKALYAKPREATG